MKFPKVTSLKSKNGKTDPALNTGLKILKMCGLSIEQRRAWAHFYNSTLSPEYNEVYNDLDRKNLQQINEKLSLELANNIELLNAYLDIINRAEEGFSLTELRLNYGRKVEEMLKDFVEVGILSIKETELGKIYHAGNVTPMITTNASFSMTQTMISRAHNAYIREGRETPLNFQIEDISEKGVEEIIKLQKQTWKKFLTILEENPQHQSDGGKRVFLNMFFSYLNA